MHSDWRPEDLDRLDSARELEITTARSDGTLRRWVPIWVVTVGDQVYVRTWHRRTTGWFGHAGTGERARVRVPGVEADVHVEDIGFGSTELRRAVDAAYDRTYGRGGSMTSDASASATLRLHRLNGADRAENAAG